MWLYIYVWDLRFEKKKVVGMWAMRYSKISNTLERYDHTQSWGFWNQLS